jgi:selenocysteine lyase/cysteine desulfurase
MTTAVHARERTANPQPTAVDLPIVGHGLTVPLVTGGVRRYANLDLAASAPCLTTVQDAVDAFLPWYSSVHRGSGFPSRVATAAYEGARDAVLDFVEARTGDTVVFTRHTTEAVNVLANALPEDAGVVVFAGEHHADLLPWLRGRATVLPVPASPEHALDLLDAALTAARGTVGLVAVTGASNVTGEIWPYPEITAIAHRHGARVLLDAAQLAPHRPIDLTTTGVDYVAFSGHKLYAPFGAGVLVGRPDWLAGREPLLAGGGAVHYVTVDSVIWADPPDRHEAGSPNVVGAVALGVACRTLQAAGMAAIAAAEHALVGDTAERLAAIPGVRLLRMWNPGNPRIGVLPFTVDGLPYALVAAALSAEYGIGVRHGCFCAHPLMARLLDVDAATNSAIRSALQRGARVGLPGAVRASVGLATTRDDLDRLVDALGTLTREGPRWTYRSSPDGTDCCPDPDPRPWPPLPVDLG